MTSPTWYLGSQIAGFLLTYSLHSTLLLGAAWVLSRFAFRREAWRDMAWKVALLGTLVTTAGAQIPGRDWALRVSVPLRSGVREVVSLPPVSIGSESIADLVPAPMEIAPLEIAPAVAGQAEAPEAAAPSVPVFEGTRPIGPLLFVAVWAGIALLLLARLARNRRRLYSALRDRYPAPDGPLTAMLEDLRRSAGFGRRVRLSYSELIATPLALGRSEICVPARLFDRLTAVEQRAALAHEIAHLVRRDPMWYHVAQILAAAFFFQPLQVVAIKKLRESAELLADAWAARETRSPLDLARCLEIVARWVSSNRFGVPAGSIPMAEAGSPLMTRVRRLLDDRIEEVGIPAAGRAAALMAVALLAGFAPVVLPHALAHEAVEETSQGSPPVGTPTFARSTAEIEAPDGPAPIGPTAAEPASPATVSAAVSAATPETRIQEAVSAEAAAPTGAPVSASASEELLRLRSLTLAPALADLGQPTVALASAPVRLEGIEAVREPAGVREAPESWVVVSREVDPSDFGDFDDLGRILDQWSMNELALEKRFGGMVVTHFRASRSCETFECRRMSRQGVNGLGNPEPCGVRYFVDGVPLNQDLFNRPLESLRPEVQAGLPTAQTQGPRTSCVTIRR